MVKQSAGVHPELERQLLVGAGLVQAEPQDAHPQRGRQRATSEQLVRVVWVVIPGAHAASIGQSGPVIDISQSDDRMGT